MSPDAFLALAQRDDDLGGLLLFLLFVVAPLVLRILRWLGERAGLIREEPEKSEKSEKERVDPREELRRRRAERQAAEAEGEELWKRLARGEVPEAPAPVPAPVAGPPPRPLSPEWDLPAEPGEVAAESLESAEEPAPLSMLGEVREPGEAPEVSLEAASLESAGTEPLPLGALVQPPAPAEAPVPRRPVRGFGALGRDEWRRAIVLSEVLGPPASERMRA